MMSSREEIFSWVEQQWDQKRSNIHVLNTVPLTKRDERFSLWKRKSKLACHHSYFMSWNTLWSFILYVKCETNCDRSYSMSWKKILKISSRYFILKNFFHVKPKKWRCYFLQVVPLIPQKQTFVSYKFGSWNQQSGWLCFQRLLARYWSTQNRYWSHSNRKTWFSTKVLQNFFLFILYVVEKILEDIF